MTDRARILLACLLFSGVPAGLAGMLAHLIAPVPPGVTP